MNRLSALVKNNYLGILIIVFCFQNLLQRWIPPFQYWDEFYALAAVPLFCIWLIRRKPVSRLLIGISALLAVFLLTGLYSNIRYGYQPLRIALIDAYLNVKFFLSIGTTIILFALYPADESSVLPAVRGIMAVFLLSFIAEMGMYLWKLIEGYPFSFGVKLFYEHPAYLGAACAFMLCIIVGWLKDGTEKTVYVSGLLALMILTVKSKIVGSALLFLILYIWLVKMKRKLDFRVLAGLGVALLALGWNKIYFYFVYINDSARSVLTGTGLKIAKEYFPVGTGFGTFGSYYSGLHYSPVYKIYGIDKHRELGQQTRHFISDTFWPMIAGQNGALGLICYAGALLLLFYLIQKIAKLNRKYYFMSLYAFLFLCVASLAESAFVNTYAVMLTMPIGIGLLKFIIRERDQCSML